MFDIRHNLKEKVRKETTFSIRKSNNRGIEKPEKTVLSEGFYKLQPTVKLTFRSMNAEYFLYGNG